MHVRRAIALLIPFALAAQPRDSEPKLARHPQNLGFQVGRTGNLPPGWILTSGDGFSAHDRFRGIAVRRGCLTVAVCAELTTFGPSPKPPFASLMQTIAADQYRGKFIRLRAFLRRATTGAASSARLWMRVDNEAAPRRSESWFTDSRTRFCDARPLDWTECEIWQQVGDEAKSISFGVTLNWRGPLWIDRVSFDSVNDPPNTEPPGGPVSVLTARIRQAIIARQPDDTLARSLRGFVLSERLLDRVIEELESEGPESVGSRTEEELIALRDSTSFLAAPASSAFPSPPAPTVEEQQRLINNAGEYALRYASRLPDFLCTQTVQRSEDRDGKGWKPMDVLGLQVGYFDGSEHYRLDTVNRKASKARYESVRGASSQGELGSMMVEVLRAHAAKFSFDHWTTLRGHRASVFRFSIPASNSNYYLEFAEAKDRPHSVIAGQRGYLYLDANSASVLRIMRFSEEIPPDFPIEDASTTLDYDTFEVAGERYLLPLKADVRMERDGVGARNEITFGGYRKFTGESKISFQ